MMGVSDVLREVGRPIAYYPGLASRLGGINAAVLFCQIFYWQDKATSELGVHKTRDELEAETGLSHEEQMTARRKLKLCGVLVETPRRIDHKVYFRIDEEALEALLSTAADPAVKRGSPKPGKTVSGNRKIPSRETGNDGSGKPGKTVPRNGQSRRRGEGDPGFVNGVKTTAETTKKSSGNAREAVGVDKSEAAAAAGKKKTGSLPPTVAEPLPPELELTNLLVALETARGKRYTVDASKDRLHVLTWVGWEITPDQLREAHRRAAAARERDHDDRPVNAGFVARFVEELRAEGTIAGPSGIAEWWRGSETELCNAGVRLGVRPKKPDEHLHWYRVLVAAASRERAAIDFVLTDAQRFNNTALYQFAVMTFGDALMPADYYAS